MLSDYLKNSLLDYLLQAVTGLNSPVYVALHTGDPGSTGANEVTGGGYARQAVGTSAWNAAAMGVATNMNAIQFTNMPAAVLTYVSLWDAPIDDDVSPITYGNFLWGGPMTAPETVNSGDTFQINGGNLSASLLDT